MYVPHQVTIKNTQFQDHLLYQLYIQETSNLDIVILHLKSAVVTKNGLCIQNFQGWPSSQYHHAMALAVFLPHPETQSTLWVPVTKSLEAPKCPWKFYCHMERFWLESSFDLTKVSTFLCLTLQITVFWSLPFHIWTGIAISSGSNSLW